MGLARATIALEGEYSDFSVQWMFCRAAMNQVGALPHQFNDETKITLLCHFLDLLDWLDAIETLQDELGMKLEKHIESMPPLHEKGDG